MSFSAAWLALREPYDVAARNRDVLAALADGTADRTAIAVVDLACGTGATRRAIADVLPARQSWRLVDNDLSLLARAHPDTLPRDTIVMTTPIDLDRDLEIALDGPIDLVTTSAFLDLVSDEWLERFVVEVAVRRLPVYAALTYDGRVALDPVDSVDAAIVDALNRHQRTDKGFGPALGPDAVTAAIGRFERTGYTVAQGRSDWVFGPDDRTIQTEIITGWAAAAREIGGLPLDAIVDWVERRHRLVATGRSSMRVGHVDVFARPIGTR